jgi:hypothetical protein
VAYPSHDLSKQIRKARPGLAGDVDGARPEASSFDLDGTLTEATESSDTLRTRRHSRAADGIDSNARETFGCVAGLGGFS